MPDFASSPGDLLVVMFTQIRDGVTVDELMTILREFVDDTKFELYFVPPDRRSLLDQLADPDRYFQEAILHDIEFLVRSGLVEHGPGGRMKATKAGARMAGGLRVPPPCDQLVGVARRVLARKSPAAPSPPATP